VRTPLAPETRDWILAQLPQARATMARVLDGYKRLLDGPLRHEQRSFGSFASLFMALVGPDGCWETLDGALRLVDSRAQVVASVLSADDYDRFLGEVLEDWSVLKFPYYRPLGYPKGLYRVGPLARLNVCTAIGTPWADAELADFRGRGGTPASGGRIVTAAFAYHQARLVEIVACLEGIEALLQDPRILDRRVRAHASLNALEAVGVGEAPRGTLFHHYRVDDNGLLTAVNLIIATGQNNLAMNRTVAQIARACLPWPLPASAAIPEALLNRVEAGIRCYDPCLSCSTHAAGAMPLHIELRDASGALLCETVRD
jgi:NAD-reducing hydrogenase large subunit